MYNDKKARKGGGGMDGREEIVTQYVDGVPCRLLREEDFSWLKAYGKALKIGDGRPSGVLWFFMEGQYGRLIVKYAGAWTAAGGARPHEAVMRLKDAAEYYAAGHPALLPLLAHGAAGAGSAAVFPWTETPPLSECLTQARWLPLDTLLRMLDGVFELHAWLSDNGMVSAGVSDRNVLMDMKNGRAVVWDIDQYRRKPAKNDRGRMYGDSRFLSPEEYEKDQPLTESTTVYHLGALVFMLLGNGEDRERESWIGPGSLYPVAERACREKRGERPPSVRAFLDGWREAVGRLYQ